MKQRIIALSLVGVTALTVSAFPLINNVGAMSNPGATLTQPVIPAVSPSIVSQHQVIDLVFALDTTGSMGGMIQAAKEKIWSIATTMASAKQAPTIRIGLVAYRDRGDAYVTRVIDLSDDLDTMYATLMDFKAGGGGDGPESVNAALHDAVTQMSWSQSENAYKVVFLVGDAPPHMDYRDDVKYPEVIRMAQANGIIVNTILCGNNRGARSNWQQIAQLAGGEYFQVNQNGSAVAMKTPYDKQLSDLSRRLDDSRLNYGTAAQKAKARTRNEATRKLHAGSSVASQARRAAFNASASGADNRFGKRDLAADVAAGKVSLEEVQPEALPAPMQSLAPAERKALITKTVKQRRQIQAQIGALTKKRESFLREQLKDKAADSLDIKLFNAVKSQAAAKGLEYESDAVKF